MKVVIKTPEEITGLYNNYYKLLYLKISTDSLDREPHQRAFHITRAEIRKARKTLICL